MKATPQASDYLKLHIIVLILGFTAILGKLTTISPLALVLYRTLLASIGLFIYSKFKKTRVARLRSPEMVQLLGTGAIIATHWICFFGSAKISTVAVSLVAVSTTSFFTSILEPISNHKKISFIEVFLGIMVIIGLIIIFTFEFRYIVGLLIGLAGALLAAIFSIINSHFAKKYESQQVIQYEMVGAFITSLLYLFLYVLLTSNYHISIIPTALDWLWIGLLGFVCTIFPYLGMQNLLKKMSAFVLSLCINLEPIYGIILGFFIFGEKEKMNLGFYVGSCLILLSVIIYPFLIRQKK